MEERDKGGKKGSEGSVLDHPERPSGRKGRGGHKNPKKKNGWWRATVRSPNRKTTPSERKCRAKSKIYKGPGGILGEGNSYRIAEEACKRAEHTAKDQ